MVRDARSGAPDREENLSREPPMTNRFGIRTALAALAALALCAPAQAQLFRAYLASDGSDANPCTLSSRAA
jgi:hypothetical protein